MVQVAYSEKLNKKLNAYCRKYLNNQYQRINEASTRLIANHLLVDVLGYKELVEVKPEHYSYPNFFDYLIEGDMLTSFIVEVKPRGTTLKKRHITQAVVYAGMSCIDFVMLTDCDNIQIYKTSRVGNEYMATRILNLKLSSLSNKSAKELVSISREKNSVSYSEFLGLH